MPQIVLLRKRIVNLKMVLIKKNSSKNAARTIAATRWAQAKMKTTIIILIFVSTLCFGQNDTIYLYDNYIELNGLKYNIINNEIKTGNWIDFSIEDNTFISSLGSGVDVHFHYTIYKEYRPLKQGEYNGIEKLTSENEPDTINGQIIYSGNYQKITNRVPPDIYYITGKGSYNNNKKQGYWTYYYKNGKLKKEINYKDGIPQEGFIIFRNDETKMIEITKVLKDDDEYWQIIKYSETGKEIGREKHTIEELKEIY